jgi:hypothetical protein
VIRIDGIDIDVFDPKDFIVAWDFSNPKNEPLSGYKLHIYKSNDEHGAYKKVAKNLAASGATTWRDKRTTKADNWMNLFYKIEIERSSDGKKTTYGPTSRFERPNPADQMLAERIRSELENFGEEVVVFSKPADGVRCECFNEILGQIEIPNCTKCGGTGYGAGFYTHFFTHMEIPQETLNETTENATEQRQIQTFRMGNFPALRRGYLVVNKLNRRYIVDDISQVAPHFSIVEQVFTAIRVKESDLQMHVEVPSEFKEL